MKIQVCTGKTCKSKFSEYILKRLKSDEDFYNWKNIKLDTCMCTGNCKEGPVVIFDGNLEKYVSPSSASKIVQDKKNISNKKSTSKKKNLDNN